MFMEIAAAAGLQRRHSIYLVSGNLDLKNISSLDQKFVG
jgi:hypothetical protein